MAAKGSSNRNSGTPKRTVRSSVMSKIFGGNSTDAQEADWSAADPQIIAGIIVAVGKLDGAARFGYSRDKGAYSIGIYIDDDRETLYYPCTSDIDANLRVLLDNLEAALT